MNRIRVKVFNFKGEIVDEQVLTFWGTFYPYLEKASEAFEKVNIKRITMEKERDTRQ